MIDLKKYPSILLVEDDKAYQELIKRIVKKNDDMPNKNLYIVDNGEDALDFLTNKNKFKDKNMYLKPDIVLLDLNIPKIDGIELLKKIKKDPNLQMSIVIILTTSRREEDILSSYSAGANSYIVKPSEFDNIEKMFTVLYNYWLHSSIIPLKHSK